ncbi:MAG: hypothetical protein IPQ18_00050 [Saprospiraceae bacterium]|jgi:hypothetical protein|nr:hypothetical protein [Saprospiraceae bacterium]
MTMIEWDETTHSNKSQGSWRDFEAKISKVLEDINVDPNQLLGFFDVLKDKRWLEVDAQLSEADQTLHVFKSNGEYLISKNGSVGIGHWQQFDTKTGILLRKVFPDGRQKNESYDPVFVHDDFIILKKHGNKASHISEQRYLFLMDESFQVNEISADEILEQFARRYAKTSPIVIIIFAIVATVILGILWKMFLH